MGQNIAPKVSVVMSVYNGEKYLKECIDSILAQTFTDFEFIIINDGSEDNSQTIVESYSDNRIKLINQENKGLAYSLNKGIGASRAEVIARMDADDISMLNRFELQYLFLKENPEYIVVGSNALVIDALGSPVYTEGKKEHDAEIRAVFPETPFIHPSVMFRKEAFIRAGKYAENMLRSQDLVLFNRIAKYGKLANIPIELLKYRIVPFSNSVRNYKQAMIFNNVKQEAIKYNKLSDKSLVILKNLIQSTPNYVRYYDYHVFLAKKYLYENHERNKVISHCIAAFKYKKGIIPVILICSSILPKIITVYFYKFYKKLFASPYRPI